MTPNPSALPVRAGRDGSLLEGIEVREHEVHVHLDDRHYRVRGLEKNPHGHQLRVNLLVERQDLVHLDTLDLYKAAARNSFIKAAARELYVEEELVKRDLGQLLLKLEAVQCQWWQDDHKAEQVELSERDRDQAMNWLRQPRLIERILADYETCGLVGEETNKLVCYLACVSRLLPSPLALLIQSSSAAGKTTLMDAALGFVPPEHFVRYSAMTGQSLYYMGRNDLRHKILAVAEEAGVAEASYALKLLQSDGGLRIAATGKHSGTGRQQTESYEVEGPVMMLLTTTAEHPDTELQNRCLVLRVNESPEQTAAIQERQRTAYLEPVSTNHEARDQVIQLHQNAQRLLKPLPVVIPFADKLRFRNDQVRMRRDHAKYLSLIAASALLHQYQRPRRMRPLESEANGEPHELEYVEAIHDDVQLVGRLLGEVLGQSLDALLPQTRQLLVLIDTWITERARKEKQPRHALRFTQRELREKIGWGDFQLRRHLRRLVELEYVLTYRTGRGNQRAYQLLYEGRDGEDPQDKFFLGVTDPS